MRAVASVVVHAHRGCHTKALSPVVSLARPELTTRWQHVSQHRRLASSGAEAAATQGRRRRPPQRRGADATAAEAPARAAPTDDGPPPGLARLELGGEELESVLQLGRSKGPRAAYESLVRDGVLQPDAAQAQCAEALQRHWSELRAHRAAVVAWEAERAEWQAEHAAWRAACEELRVARASAQPAPRAAGAAEGEGKGDKEKDETQTDEFADLKLPPEPVEPRMPTLASHGCYVWGGVGGGKSLLMDLFVESCGAASELGRAKQRVHFHEFMLGVHRELHRLRQAGAERTTRTVAQGIAERVQLIAFDEFQITNIADALIVETLFDALFEVGVVVTMTSNRPPDDLYKDGLNRHLAIPQFMELLDRRGIVFTELAAARDFREAALESAGALPADGPWRDFFNKSKAAGHAEDFLRSAFRTASAGSAGTRTAVPIAWGRSLEVAHAAGGVGRFTFRQLCGTALNADDYLSLAKHFHTLVIEDVPRFTLDQHNEARRFTNLVDCAYERHARLVLSADAPPRELLASMEGLADLTLSSASRSSRTDSQARMSRPAPDGASVTDAVRLAAQGPNDAAPGNDDTNTGSGVVGVMAGAVGSLQESGFAARRATSRLLHMQTEEYLAAHRRHRLGGAE